MLLVDADPMGKSIDKVFKLSKSPGLREAITGQIELKQCMHSTSLDNLFVVPTGSNRGAFFDPAAAVVLLQSCKEDFDCIVGRSFFDSSV